MVSYASELIRRSEFLTNLSYSILHPAINALYKIRYENADRLKELKDDGFILLPKHQCYLDIVVEDFLVHETLGKHAYFIMHSNLVRALELLGGIGITRKKDLDKIIEDQGAARIQKLEAINRKKQVNEAIVELLDNNEVVVVHFEGTRHYNAHSKIIIPNIANLTGMQKIRAKPIIFMPLDIYYSKESYYSIVPKPGSEIVMTVGEPITVPDTGFKLLAEHLKKSIKLVH